MQERVKNKYVDIKYMQDRYCRKYYTCFASLIAVLKFEKNLTRFESRNIFHETLFNYIPPFAIIPPVAC